MKRIICLVVLFFTFSISFAQKGGNKTPEERALASTAEMKEVLELNDSEEKAIYAIQLEKFKGLFEASKIESVEEKKAEKKKVVK